MAEVYQVEGGAAVTRLHLYTYLDLGNPVVAWEAAIGRMMSAKLLQRHKDIGMSLRQFSMMRKSYLNNNLTPIFSEFTLDNIRQNLFPDRVSRLQNLFFFETKEMAEAIIGRPGWNAGHFKPENLSKVEVFARNISRYDSEWITYQAFNNTDPSWMQSYLAGETFGETPLTELLVEGVGIILNNEIKERAYKHVEKYFPNSIALLTAAKRGYENTYINAGQITPFCTMESQKLSFKLAIYLDDFKNNSEFMDFLKKNPIPEPEKDFYKKTDTPDLRHLFFSIPIDNE